MSGVAKLNVDRREFDALMTRLRTTGAERASKVAAVAVARVFLDVVIVNAPRDTNKFVRGYEMARNMLPGVTPRPLSPLKPSKFAEEYGGVFERDLAYAERVRAGAQRKLRKLEAIRENTRRSTKGGAGPRFERAAALRKLDKRIRDARKNLDKAGDLEDRAIESLDEYRRAMADGGVGFTILFARRRGRKSSAVALSRLARGFSGSRSFGGSAEVVKVSQTLWLVRIENREPHAFIVNKRSRVLNRAIAAARVTGARRATPAVARELAAVAAGRVSGGRAA